MSSSQLSETGSPKPSPSRGVWGFMKRKVWGDVASHPISDTSSESQRAQSPDDADLTTGIPEGPDMSTPAAEPRPHSPFQSHTQTPDEEEPVEDARLDHVANVTSNNQKDTHMASEPSLRHGLGEGLLTASTCAAIDRLS